MKNRMFKLHVDLQKSLSMKLNGRLILVMSLAFAPVEFSFAQTTTATSAAGPATLSNSGITTTTTTTTDGSDKKDGIQKTAKGASIMQIGGMIAGGAAAGYSAPKALAACNAREMTGCVGWTLGTAAGLGVATMMAIAAAKSDDTKSKVTDPDSTTTTTPVVPFNPTTSAANTTVQPYIAAARKANPNLQVNPDGTAVLPDGRKVNALSPQSIASNLTPAEQAAFKDIQAQIAAEANKAMKAATDGTDVLAGDDGNAGGGKAGSTTVTDAGGGGGGAKAAGGMAGGRSLASVAGLTRKLDGEPIGGAGDDLFGMIHRRYDLKNKQSTFIGSPKAPVASALPPGI